MEQKFIIRSRAIIVQNLRLLLVRHPHDTSYAALPGGHVEFGEDPRACMYREVVEELGVEPMLGRLLYIHPFVDRNNIHSLEFFFEVTNGEAFVGCELRDRSHAQELDRIEWATPSDDIHILPEEIGEDFRNDRLFEDDVRFVPSKPHK